MTSKASPVSADRPSFSISDLAAEFGITPRALRFYEDEGLIAPRRDGLARIYSRRDRGRLAWIIRGKNVGFSLSEIRELLDIYESEGGPDEQRRAAVAKCRERVAMLQRQREDIDASIKELADFICQVEAVESQEEAAEPLHNGKTRNA